MSMITTCRRCKEVYGRWRPRCPVCGLSEAQNAIQNARAAGEREKARREGKPVIKFVETSVRPKPPLHQHHVTRPENFAPRPVLPTVQLDPEVPMMSLGDALKKVL